MAKQTKTKRKLAHPTLPMQRQLNLQHEGTHFDLRPIFDRLNQRYFRGRLRGYKVIWGRRRRHRPREYFVFGTIQEEDRVIESIHHLINHSFRFGFSSTCFITKCCILWCRTRALREAVGACTRKNSIAESGRFETTVAPGAGKKKICRAFCASLRLSVFPSLSCQRSFQTARRSSLRSF